MSPEEMGIKVTDMTEQARNSLNFGGIKAKFMKVFIRQKLLKDKDILEISAELEEKLSDEDFDYANMNVREEKYLHLLINDYKEKMRIKEFFLAEEVVLAVETDGKRAYGQHVKSKEKKRFREEQKQEKEKKFDL